MVFENKNVLLAVTGSISAYKACDLIQRLKDEGATIKVIMTSSACELVHPNTFATLSGSAVITNNFSGSESGRMDHIDLARWADHFVIAPCTAHTLGEIANGLTGSIVSLVYLVYDKPVFIAPAMNSVMLSAKSVQRNLELLKAKGDVILPTGEGILACGEVGYGKLLDVGQIILYLKTALAQKNKSLNLRGKKVLISVGHTEEKWDDVRFISNRSSGKTGFSIARAFQMSGAHVHLVVGVVEEPIPPGFRVTRVTTSSEFQTEMLSLQAASDVVIMAAAIADFTPATQFSGKQKDSKNFTHLELSAFPNILKELGLKKKPSQILVGFALETVDAIAYAKQKMQERNCDVIVVNNPIATKFSERETGAALNNVGFGETQVMATLLFNDSVEKPNSNSWIPSTDLIVWDKDALAAELVNAVDSIMGSTKV